MVKKMLSEKEKKYLLEIARKIIENALQGKKLEINEKELTPALKEKAGAFVTLEKNHQLRGCIGIIEARARLIDAVKGNALNAAFNDPRFDEVDESELNEIKIEISVLSKPQEIKFENAIDLLKKIDEKMGIVLEKNGRQATFLPQVWEQLPDKAEFLNELAMKAGLPANAWREKAKISFYKVEKFEE